MKIKWVEAGPQYETAEFSFSNGSPARLQFVAGKTLGVLRCNVSFRDENNCVREVLCLDASSIDHAKEIAETIVGLVVFAMQPMQPKEEGPLWIAQIEGVDVRDRVSRLSCALKSTPLPNEIRLYKLDRGKAKFDESDIAFLRKVGEAFGIADEFETCVEVRKVGGWEEPFVCVRVRRLSALLDEAQSLKGTESVRGMKEQAIQFAKNIRVRPAPVMSDLEATECAEHIFRVLKERSQSRVRHTPATAADLVLFEVDTGCFDVISEQASLRLQAVGQKFGFRGTDFLGCTYRKTTSGVRDCHHAVLSWDKFIDSLARL